MGSSRQTDIAQSFAVVARDLSTQSGVAATTDRVAEMAAKLIGCGWAAVGRLGSHGAVVFDSSGDSPVLTRIESITSATGDGVAWEALRRRDSVLVHDLATERRWPSFTARVLAETPVRSALAYFLRLDEIDLGVLALYAAEPRFFTEQTAEVAAIFADHAAIAVSHALDQDKVTNLEEALRSNREIGVALGVLMTRYTMTQQQAFDLLRTVSQRTHRKLRDVAGDVAFTGALPEVPARRLVDDVGGPGCGAG
jgi:GAF domain-containing protein